jgi:hypothetical protein
MYLIKRSTNGKDCKFVVHSLQKGIELTKEKKVLSVHLHVFPPKLLDE